MPWTCPACRLAIQHSDSERAPRPGVTYRCHVCRLELVVDPQHGKMTVAPLRSDLDDGRRGDAERNEDSRAGGS